MTSSNTLLKKIIGVKDVVVTDAEIYSDRYYSRHLPNQTADQPRLRAFAASSMLKVCGCWGGSCFTGRLLWVFKRPHKCVRREPPQKPAVNSNHFSVKKTADKVSAALWLMKEFLEFLRSAQLEPIALYCYAGAALCSDRNPILILC